MTAQDEWGYCPTKENPADLLTRGLTAEQFLQNALWFNGPEWLTEEEKWPTWKSTLTDSTVLSSFVEHENNDDPTTKDERNCQNDIIMDITLSNSLFKTIRVTAFILRFVANYKIPNLHVPFILK